MHKFPASSLIPLLVLLAAFYPGACHANSGIPILAIVWPLFIPLALLVILALFPPGSRQKTAFFMLAAMLVVIAFVLIKFSGVSGFRSDFIELFFIVATYQLLLVPVFFGLGVIARVRFLVRKYEFAAALYRRFCLIPAFILVPSALISIGFWLWFSSGSWHHARQPIVAGQSGDCGSFDLGPLASGRMHSSARRFATIDKSRPGEVRHFSNGYFLLNRGVFDFGRRPEYESRRAVVWLNPFNASMTVYYHWPESSRYRKGEFQIDEGLKFDWHSAGCGYFDADILEHPAEGSAGLGAVHSTWIKPLRFKPGELPRAVKRVDDMVLYEDELFLGAESAAASGKVIIFDKSRPDWKLAAALNGEKPDFAYREDSFGAAVDIDNDVLIVGSPGDDLFFPISESNFADTAMGSKYGAEKIVALLREKNYINAQGILMGPYQYVFKPKVRADDFPGFSGRARVKIQDVLNDARAKDGGSVYIFGRDGGGWQQQALLMAVDARDGMQFGSRVALANNTALACARGGKFSASSKTPGAYLFQKSTDGWSQTSKIARGVCIDVAISENWAFATMIGKSETNGHNYTLVLKKNGGNWEMQQRLISQNSDNHALKGHLVISADEKTLIITAPTDNLNSDPANRGAGSVSIFQRAHGQWQLMQKLSHPSAEFENAAFGSAVGLAGAYLAIGAPGKSEPSQLNQPVGKVYLYKIQGDEWRLDRVISPMHGAAGDSFGRQLVIDDNELIVASTPPKSRKSRINRYQIPVE